MVQSKAKQSEQRMTFSIVLLLDFQPRASPLGCHWFFDDGFDSSARVGTVSRELRYGLVSVRTPKEKQIRHYTPLGKKLCEHERHVGHDRQ
jgi:hypothetical protein